MGVLFYDVINWNYVYKGCGFWPTLHISVSTEVPVGYQLLQIIQQPAYGKCAQLRCANNCLPSRTARHGIRDDTHPEPQSV